MLVKDAFFSIHFVKIYFLIDAISNVLGYFLIDNFFDPLLGSVRMLDGDRLREVYCASFKVVLGCCPGSYPFPPVGKASYVKQTLFL